MSGTFTDPDAGKSPEQLFAERSKRLQDAIQLKQPDRIPIQLDFSYMLAEMNGVTRQEQHENGEKEMEMLEKAALRFQPDSCSGLYNNPGAALAVGDVMTKYPGHGGMDANGSFQFVEGEYMKGEDYDAFIDDPSDWCIRKYWPRVFKELEGLAYLPPLSYAAFGTYALANLGSFKAPPIAAAFRALANAIEAQAAADARLMAGVGRLIAAGFSPITFGGCETEAPFDLMSDTLRGMKGIMMDMYRRPEKLLAAQEKMIRMQLDYAIQWSNATGIKISFIPLHRGSDAFMSIAQFEKFYWPQLKALMLGLIDAGITPHVFYEGTWDQRLHYLAELPKGKSVGWFQTSDIFKVKEIVGDTMCIMGGMKNSLLKGGTADEVRKFTIELCEKVGKGGGFIMTTTIGEMEGSNPDLVKVWVDTTKEYGVYK
jgi:hypothetical protein